LLKSKYTGLPSARQAEQPLADDVALDLVRAGVDRVAARLQEPELPAPALFRERPLRDLRQGAEDLERQLRDALIQLDRFLVVYG
jgi:hypothetical protein